MTPRGGWIVCVTLAVTLVSTVLVDRAGARARPGFSAKIAGRPLRARGPRVSAYASTVFHLVASNRNGRRAAVFDCVTLDFASATFPLPLSSCSGFYQLTKVGRHPSVKQWQTSSGIQLTIESYDGTTARGTLGGTLEFSAEGDPPAAVVNGRFDVPVTNLLPTAHGIHGASGIHG